MHERARSELAERSGIHPVAADERSWLLDALFADAADPMFMKDTDGRYLVVNEAAARALGRPVADVVGRRDDELVAPELASELAAHDRDVLESGRTALFEETLAGPEGRRTWRTSKGPVRDGEGRVIGL